MAVRALFLCALLLSLAGLASSACSPSQCCCPTGQMQISATAQTSVYRLLSAVTGSCGGTTELDTTCTLVGGKCQRAAAAVTVLGGGRLRFEFSCFLGASVSLFCSSGSCLTGGFAGVYHISTGDGECGVMTGIGRGGEELKSTGLHNAAAQGGATLRRGVLASASLWPASCYRTPLHTLAWLIGALFLATRHNRLFLLFLSSFPSRTLSPKFARPTTHIVS